MQRMVRGLGLQGTEAAFKAFWMLMRVFVVQVLQVPCFLEYFEHTYIDPKAPGRGTIFHHPDTWAMYSILDEDMDEIMRKINLCLLKVSIIYYCSLTHSYYHRVPNQ